MQEGNINKWENVLERETDFCSWASQLGVDGGKERVVVLEVGKAIGPVLGWGR